MRAANRANVSNRWIGLVFAVLCALTAPAQEPAKPEAPKPGAAKEQAPAEKPESKPAEIPAAPAPVDPKTYVIGVEDVIQIRVWRELELSNAYVVRPDGKISMPLAGEIEASGATPDVLKERVVAALSATMVKPEVTIEIRQVNSKKYFISGEVNRPGAFSLVTPVSVLEAISNAGGLREFANGKKILVMRGEERLKFNYREVIKGKKMEQNIQLKPGDHVVIP
jgi:polysaccharide export outer membrane protein